MRGTVVKRLRKEAKRRTWNSKNNMIVKKDGFKWSTGTFKQVYKDLKKLFKI